MRYLQVKSKIFQLYLRGLRGFFESQDVTVNKRKMRIILSLIFSLYSYGWIQHNWMKHEFDIRKQPNFLIPIWVYHARREHYIYYEQSRLARGLSTTFSYYDWDPVSQMVCYTDKQGKQKFEKSIFNRERLDIIDNALFEEIFRGEMTSEKIKRGSLLVAYELNCNNRFDLDNYLHYKPINPMDFIRGLHFQFYVQLGLTNQYRYDHFISKPDWLYEWEQWKIELNGMDRLNFFNKLIELK
ncbi:unnamed protein product [Paramecium pentaurelia]|uniref:Uncharacterized protein n=1 Tax=Paramecium pentaurelia TaxID=43138 RepID=A0A8S1XA76_9CILI|nr:unnamed protein product [Paramecium pentaurelia]